ncbi:hypothetical protein COB52_05135 [Candidatus Kaiserbacteria bacterium]|nr:MAG: hypothetical protein COB52_05135 [Candidatus Kaiserbacteria bacterium]
MENNSEDSFDEQDMVYYQKDDMTQYSKHLGLNKVKKKNLFSYSEGDCDGTSRSSSESNTGKGKGAGDSFNKSFKSGISKGGKFGDKSLGDKSGRSGRSGRSGKSGKSGNSTRNQSPENRWKESAWNDRRLRKKKRKMTK